MWKTSLLSEIASEINYTTTGRITTHGIEVGTFRRLCLGAFLGNLTWKLASGLRLVKMLKEMRNQSELRTFLRRLRSEEKRRMDLEHLYSKERKKEAWEKEPGEYLSWFTRKGRKESGQFCNLTLNWKHDATNGKQSLINHVSSTYQGSQRHVSSSSQYDDVTFSHCLDFDFFSFVIPRLLVFLILRQTYFLKQTSHVQLKVIFTYNT